MNATALYSTITDSPVGSLTIVASDRGLRAILWPGDGDGRVRPGTSTNDPDHLVIAGTVAQLDEYFSGERRSFDLPLDPLGTPFQQSVWTTLRSIPYAHTISYGEQAERLGDRRKARAVGAANGRNPISIVVPCHRVVGASGALTGFAAGVETKAWLLDHERHVAGVTLDVTNGVRHHE